MYFEFIFLKDHSNNPLHRVELNLEGRLHDGFDLNRLGNYIVGLLLHMVQNYSFIITSICLIHCYCCFQALIEL